MSSRCLSNSCKNGNCEGCRNGSKYCNDPRCYPNCPDCDNETQMKCVNRRDGWDWTLIIILTGLALISLLLVAWMIWGHYSAPTPADQSQTAQTVQTYQTYTPPVNRNYAAPVNRTYAAPVDRTYAAPVDQTYSVPPASDMTFSPELDSSLDVSPFSDMGAPDLSDPTTATVSSARTIPPQMELPTPGPSLNDSTIRGFQP